MIEEDFSEDFTEDIKFIEKEFALAKQKASLLKDLQDGIEFMKPQAREVIQKQKDGIDLDKLEILVLDTYYASLALVEDITSYLEDWLNNKAPYYKIALEAISDW